MHKFIHLHGPSRTNAKHKIKNKQRDCKSNTVITITWCPIKHITGQALLSHFPGLFGRWTEERQQRRGRTAQWTVLTKWTTGSLCQGTLAPQTPSRQVSCHSHEVHSQTTRISLLTYHRILKRMTWHTRTHTYKHARTGATLANMQCTLITFKSCRVP